MASYGDGNANAQGHSALLLPDAFALVAASADEMQITSRNSVFHSPSGALV